VVVAAIKKTSTSLKALTAAALSLPGLFSPMAHAAEGDEVDFQYSHYQEGKRNISYVGENGITGSKSFNPIEVDSLHGSARVSLTDGVKFAFNYLQDTWGGATPVATTPYLASGNAGVPNSKGITVGASPYATAGAGLVGFHFVNRRLNSLFATDRPDPNTGLPFYKQDRRLTHVMATASPETRKQGDFKLSYDWDEMALSAGGGISIEDDYESRFGNIGGRFDFNQKLTTLNVDLSYTNSFTNAVLDHDDYTFKTLLPSSQLVVEKGINKTTIQGTRQDWATHLGLTQVLNKGALVSMDFSYTRSTGYLSNPYKGVAVAFADFNYDRFQIGDLPAGVFPANLAFFTEQRPEVRNQYGVGGRYVQHIAPMDAALHLDYRFSGDDWGINSHTFEADWVQPFNQDWTVTPRVRYYSQDAADFYAPFLIAQQPLYDSSTGANNPKKNLPAHYSSDHRLSGYGALSGGVTVAKQFAKGLTLETGFEYYTHQGGLKIGGGGEGNYADFDYWLANAALKVNLDALALNSGDHAGHHGHQAHGVHGPAGVMFDHMLPQAGDFMVGYRYMWNSQSGNMLNGSHSVNDAAVVSNGCKEPGSVGCILTPDGMNMSMHMLDLMYAPTDWLTLMLMPQFVDMHMEMRGLVGASVTTGESNVDGHIPHHKQNPHETGGIGDLGMYALFKLYDNGTHHVHATAGLSAPTGDVNVQLRRAHTTDGGFQDYGMQLGSGTWDFKPSLTYTGHIEDWSWGAQANGTVRMEDKNRSGYSLGDLFQATAWGSYNLTNWLSASVRGVYTLQGAINGQYNGSAGGQFGRTFVDENADEQFIQSSILKFGPQDYPQNYGGRFWDVGFGLSAMVPSGDLAGNRFSVEWMQPVHTDFNGYQLDRDGALSATWGVSF
jgi:Protein of unknown function (DUF3570)